MKYFFMHFAAHTKLDFDELLQFKKCEVYYYHYYGKHSHQSQYTLQNLEISLIIHVDACYSHTKNCIFYYY